jgi:hypothetical protein
VAQLATLHLVILSFRTAFFAGEESAFGWVKADSSRDKTALSE